MTKFYIAIVIGIALSSLFYLMDYFIDDKEIM
jgi:hypothetical protein